MTNIRTTDPEILKIRFPFIIRKVILKEGSEVQEKYKGGEELNIKIVRKK